MAVRQARASKAPAAVSMWPVRLLVEETGTLAAASPRTQPAKATSRAKPVKLSFKEARELEALPAKIEALEREQSEITTQLSDSELYRTDPDKVQALQARYAAIEGELMESLAHWEALEAKQAAVRGIS